MCAWSTFSASSHDIAQCKALSRYTNVRAHVQKAVSQLAGDKHLCALPAVFAL